MKDKQLYTELELEVLGVIVSNRTTTGIQPTWPEDIASALNRPPTGVGVIVERLTCKGMVMRGQRDKQEIRTINPSFGLQLIINSKGIK